jgi:hypothetical protein
MQRAMEALGYWMSSNRLRLNASKTQFIWLGNWQQLKKIDPQAISADFPHFVFSTSVRNLGVVLDQELTFSEHLNLLSRVCFFQLRQLRVISRSLSPNAALALVHAFVCSRIDYCSAIYVGLPLERIAQLQRVLRAAARLIGGFSKFDHVSHFMRDVLHWLPASKRIEFRISVWVWRCQLGSAPAYLREFCSPITGIAGRRNLRSASQGKLVVPFARTSKMQHRAFSVVGPTTWNNLPSDLRVLLAKDSACAFYKHLKTVLYRRSWAGSASE